MPQLDLHHQTVRTALEKDGWHVTHDPYVIQFRGVRLFADLGAEKVFAAERGQRRIVVEVKTFSGLSLMSDMEKAVGQYGIYRTFLKKVDPDREIFLAISEDTYQDFFQRPAIQEIISDLTIRLLVFNSNREEVVAWIS